MFYHYDFCDLDDLESGQSPYMYKFSSQAFNFSFVLIDRAN